MNNKVYFYRVANAKYKFYGIYPMGPYSFFNHFSWKGLPSLPYTPEEYNRFSDFASNETIEYKKFKINNYRLSRVPTLPNAWRPGPFEDIDLREKMIARMEGFTKNGKFHLYGFDSMTQALHWYNNSEELTFLESLGFSMYKFRVHAKNLIVGNKQAVYFPDLNDKNEILLSSIIKLTDLNKTVTLSSYEKASTSNIH